MKKYIGLIDLSLNVNDEYYSTVENVFLGIIEASSIEEAKEYFEKYRDRNYNNKLCSWDATDYYDSIYVKELK